MLCLRERASGGVSEPKDPSACGSEVSASGNDFRGMAEASKRGGWGMFGGGVGHVALSAEGLKHHLPGIHSILSTEATCTILGRHVKFSRLSVIVRGEHSGQAASVRCHSTGDPSP